MWNGLGTTSRKPRVRVLDRSDAARIDWGEDENNDEDAKTGRRKNPGLLAGDIGFAETRRRASRSSTLVGTGSEVSLCLTACEQLSAEGLQVRVVSMPSWELFDEQSQDYQDRVLPPAVTARVSVENPPPSVGIATWAARGVVLGMKTFGMSAPIKVVAEHFGFVTEHVVAAAKEVLGRTGK